MSKFKPMLAGKVPDDLSELKFPLLVSLKLDGVRAVVLNGVVVSRSLKPIPNKYIQQLYGRPEFEGLDGELIWDMPTSPSCFRDTVSVVMSNDHVGGLANTDFYVFDYIYSVNGYLRRLEEISLNGLKHPSVTIHGATLCKNVDELKQIYASALDAGYEGLILRSLDSPYKCGRSTTKEGYMLKYKPYEDAEAVVVGIEQEMQNNNDPTINALGNTERSSHQANKTGKGAVGALIVKYNDVEFSVGVFQGVTKATLRQWWQDGPEKLIGRVIKFRYLAIGMKDKPRSPVFLGWRHEDDN